MYARCMQREQGSCGSRPVSPLPSGIASARWFESTGSTPRVADVARARSGRSTLDDRRRRQQRRSRSSGELASDRDAVGYLVDRWVAGKIDVSGKTPASCTNGQQATSRRVSAPFASIVSNETTWRGGLTASPPGDASLVEASRFCAWCCVPRSTTPWPRASCAAAPPPVSACPNRSRGPGISATSTPGAKTSYTGSWSRSAGHRWEAPLRLAVLYGLRRSELLGRALVSS